MSRSAVPPDAASSRLADATRGFLHFSSPGVLVSHLDVLFRVVLFVVIYRTELKLKPSRSTSASEATAACDEFPRNSHD